MRAIHRITLLVTLLLLTSCAGACRRGDLSITSVRKLSGAPARLRGLTFSGDAKTVFTVELREPDDPSVAPKFEDAKHVILARDATGKGGFKEIARSDGAIVAHAAFADGIAYVRESGPPPTVKPVDDSFEAFLDAKTKENAARVEHWKKTALYFVTANGADKRISQEGVQCRGAYGSANGKVLAYWTTAGDEPPERATIHLIDSSDWAEVTLSVTGVVLGISPDGSRVLVQRFSTTEEGPRPLIPEAVPRLKREIVVISRKDKSVTILPSTIKLGSDDVASDERFVQITEQGLVMLTGKGIWRTDWNGSSPVHVVDFPAPSPAPEGSSKPLGRVRLVFGEDRPRFIVGPKGTVWVFTPAGDRVELKAYPAKKDAPAVTLASLEGPLSSYESPHVDGAEERLAFGVLSDTTRDGTLTGFDNAEVFIASSDKGSLSFDRPAVTPLSADFVPKIAAAAGVDASKVVFATKDGGDTNVEVKLDIPEGATATSFVDKVMSVARAVTPVLPKKLNPKLKITMGPATFDVTPRKDVVSGVAWNYIDGSGLLFHDPEAPLLRLRDPKQVTFSRISNETIKQTGELENPGRTATPPITAFILITTGYGKAKSQHEITKEMGVIEPGKRASYELIAEKGFSQNVEGPMFRTPAGRVSIFNLYAREHELNFLEIALDLHRAHGVWASHDSIVFPLMRVTITDAQAALPDKERDAFFKKIFERISKHQSKYHKHIASSLTVEMATASGVSYRVTSDSVTRFEPKKPADP